MSERLTIETDRLRLTALTAEALSAWLRNDAEDLRAETGVDFESPVEALPTFEEDLPRFRERMLEAVDDLGWWAWVVSMRDGNRAVGVCGLGGRPEDGRVVIGYAVFPRLEGRGYATEASAGLIRWAMTHVDVEVIRATVPTWNLGSVAVARKLGMTLVAHRITADVGEVALYEMCRDPASDVAYAVDR